MGFENEEFENIFLLSPKTFLLREISKFQSEFTLRLKLLSNDLVLDQCMPSNLDVFVGHSSEVWLKIQQEYFSALYLLLEVLLKSSSHFGRLIPTKLGYSIQILYYFVP